MPRARRPSVEKQLPLWPPPQPDPRPERAAEDAGDGSAVDRLSALQQPIWSHILSLLPTRDAVATGLLSRRWRRRWLHLPHLDLDPDDFKPDGTTCSITCRLPHFARFVNLVLPACAVRRSLRRLALRPGCRCRGSDTGIDRWVRLAMAGRQITAMELDFSRLTWDYEPGASSTYDRGPISPPETLKELKLLSCIFNPSEFGSFAALKTLVLSSVTLGGDPTSQCPLLECLTMTDCCFKRGLEIQHPHLRRLELENSTFEWTGETMVIDASALETLSVVGPLWCEALLVHNALQLQALVVENCFSNEEERLGASLDVEAPKLSSFRFVGAVGRECSILGSPHLDSADVKAYPWTDGEDADNSRWVRKLLKGVASARSLTVSGCCIQCLSTETDTLVKLANPFHNLKVLTLSLGLVYEEIPGIACLLRSSPILQTLSISLSDESHDTNDNQANLDYELQNLHRLYGDYWESQESPIQCLVHHLKRIEIRNYKGKQLEEELARFLVNNGMVLKEMPISTRTSSFSGFDFL